jgi:hypothetical protein
VSQTSGLHVGAASKKKPSTGFNKAHASGTLINDLRMGRAAFGYMHNPAKKPGAEDQTNDPKQLPSQHIVTHGDDDHAIAHEHMDNARKAKTTDEKRSHTFKALSALNKAQRKNARHF